LATSAIKTSFSTLAGDIALVSAEDIHRCGHVDWVIAGWPCQGMSMAGKQNGLLHCGERAGGEQFTVKDFGKYAQDS
jgi:site-specific DNA-cytosine methylase